jgi:predicted secreted Zn-dependent protease
MVRWIRARTQGAKIKNDPQEKKKSERVVIKRPAYSVF